MTLEQKLVNLLIEKELRIAFAESCTAGLCAATLVNVPDASKVFDASFVTYANEAKTRFLGVDEKLIEKYGVVSEPVAGQMAVGAAKETNAQIGVGVSGIAGPSGGTKEKPVGTVCFGFSVNDDVKTYTKHFGSIGRQEVRNATVEFVFKTLLDLLNNT